MGGKNKTGRGTRQKNFAKSSLPGMGNRKA